MDGAPSTRRRRMGHCGLASRRRRWSLTGRAATRRSEARRRRRQLGVRAAHLEDPGRRASGTSIRGDARLPVEPVDRRRGRGGGTQRLAHGLLRPPRVVPDDPREGSSGFGAMFLGGADEVRAAVVRADPVALLVANPGEREGVREAARRRCGRSGDTRHGAVRRTVGPEAGPSTPFEPPPNPVPRGRRERWSSSRSHVSDLGP
jgi:hypothetical protein